MSSSRMSIGTLLAIVAGMTLYFWARRFHEQESAQSESRARVIRILQAIRVVERANVKLAMTDVDGDGVGEHVGFGDLGALLARLKGFSPDAWDPVLAARISTLASDPSPQPGEVHHASYRLTMWHGAPGSRRLDVQTGGAPLDPETVERRESGYCVLARPIDRGPPGQMTYILTTNGAILRAPDHELPYDDQPLVQGEPLPWIELWPELESR